MNNYRCHSERGEESKNIIRIGLEWHKWVQIYILRFTQDDRKVAQNDKSRRNNSPYSSDASRGLKLSSSESKDSSRLYTLTWMTYEQYVETFSYNSEIILIWFGSKYYEKYERNPRWVCWQNRILQQIIHWAGECTSKMRKTWFCPSWSMSKYGTFQRLRSWIFYKYRW